MKTLTPPTPGKKTGQRQNAKSKASLRSANELIKVIQDGMGFGELEALRAHLGLPLDRLAGKLGIARATLHRRKAAGRLAPDESEKVHRFAHLFELAKTVFDGEEAARQWLSFPQFGLGGVVPLDYARTEVGGREVESLLQRIEHGVYS